MFFKSKKRIINIEKIPTELDEIRIKNTLENLVDVSKVKVKAKENVIIVNYDNTIDDILLQNTIQKLGYIVTGIKELS